MRAFMRFLFRRKRRPLRKNKKTFAGSVLLLLALGSFPSQALAQKELVFEAAPSGDGRFRFQDPNGAVFSEVELSENFAVYYNPNDIPLEYVDFAVENLEASWRFFRDAGYRHPAFADAHRVAAYIRPSFTAANEQWAAGFYRVFTRTADPYFDLKYDDLSVGENRAFATALITHEFFHFIQHAYDAHFTAGARWMWEATAAWSEDERTPGAPVIGSFLRHMPAWYLLWGMGMSLDSYNPSDANLRSMPYGGAVFFKYLSAHQPDGAASIRRIWENLSATGSGNGMQAVQNTLGGAEPFQQSLVDFAVAVWLKTHARWNVPRGAEIRANLVPRLQTKDRYLAAWDDAGQRVEPSDFTLQPFSASSFDLIAPEGTAGPSRLRLVIQRKDGSAPVLSKVIQLTRRWTPLDVVSVNPLAFDAGRNSSQLTVENYGFFFDRTSRVLLVAANPDSRPSDISVAAVVSEPPILQEVRVTQPGKGPAYQASWQGAADARRLQVTKNELKIDRGKNQIDSLEILAIFSEEMKGSPRVRIKDQEAPLADAGGGKAWMGRLGPIPVQRSERTLAFQVAGVSLGDLALDADPATVISLDSDTLQWKNLEPNSRGGPDSNHTIQLKRELDLNGLWRSSGVEVRIRHVDSSVEAATQQGRVLFQGTLNGTQMNGKMKVRYPPEWQQRCGLSEGWANLEMGVSEDEDHLSGRFQLMEIDEHCSQAPAGWKEASFVRVHEEGPAAVRR